MIPSTEIGKPLASNVTKFVDFCISIKTLFNEFPFISITSWGRSVHRNKLKGGMKNSKHLKMLAVDIVRDPKTTDKKPALLKRAKELGFTVVDEKDHIHLQVNG